MDDLIGDAGTAWRRAVCTGRYSVAQAAYLDFIEGRENARATLAGLNPASVVEILAIHLSEEPSSSAAPANHADWSQRLRDLGCAAQACMEAGL